MKKNVVALEVPLLIQPQRKAYGKVLGISLEIFLVERKAPIK